MQVNVCDPVIHCITKVIDFIEFRAWLFSEVLQFSGEVPQERLVIVVGHLKVEMVGAVTMHHDVDWFEAVVLQGYC